MQPHALEEYDGPVQILDVREPDEFAGPLGHIPGAILIPLGELAARARRAGARPADRRGVPRGQPLGPGGEHPGAGGLCRCRQSRRRHAALARRGPSYRRRQRVMPAGTAHSLRVVPSGGILGARVEGIDLRQPLAARHGARASARRWASMGFCASPASRSSPTSWPLSAHASARSRSTSPTPITRRAIRR